MEGPLTKIENPAQQMQDRETGQPSETKPKSKEYMVFDF